MTSELEKQNKEEKDNINNGNGEDSQNSHQEDNNFKENKNESSVKDGISIFDDNSGDDFQSLQNDKNENIAVSKEKEAGDSSGKGKNEKKSKKAKKKKKKEIKRINTGKAYIQATYNNTIVTLTDIKGNAIGMSSAGRLGFKGAKKSTPYAASIVVKDVINKTKNYGLQNVSVFVKGVGAGRESAVRALNANGLSILAIKDTTPFPHNGCRPKKPRRV